MDEDDFPGLGVHQGWTEEDDDSMEKAIEIQTELMGLAASVGKVVIPDDATVFSRTTPRPKMILRVWHLRRFAVVLKGDFAEGSAAAAKVNELFIKLTELWTVWKNHDRKLTAEVCQTCNKRYYTEEEPVML